ncbi:hypothetical protein B0T25DRAFT_564123 [Lasiosphaeria hispida]|uniref:Uncharacterized protein n=1 Tax=Lasiosphaeria hispida TaxID=260671 RepID=A0AAJ0HPQ0_9PEZI|nr:hypothetical protein B0T25DRAFT_564123 [Lasiosphaeria hispida]
MEQSSVFTTASMTDTLELHGLGIRLSFYLLLFREILSRWLTTCNILLCTWAAHLLLAYAVFINLIVIKGGSYGSGLDALSSWDDCEEKQQLGFFFALVDLRNSTPEALGIPGGEKELEEEEKAAAAKSEACHP